jgi:hypothetical protein
MQQLETPMATLTIRNVDAAVSRRRHDLAYAGAPPRWSGGVSSRAPSQLVTFRAEATEDGS